MPDHARQASAASALAPAPALSSWPRWARDSGQGQRQGAATIGRSWGGPGHVGLHRRALGWVGSLLEQPGSRVVRATAAEVHATADDIRLALRGPSSGASRPRHLEDRRTMGLSEARRREAAQRAVVLCHEPVVHDAAGRDHPKLEAQHPSLERGLLDRIAVPILAASTGDPQHLLACDLDLVVTTPPLGHRLDPVPDDGQIRSRWGVGRRGGGRYGARPAGRRVGNKRGGHDASLIARVAPDQREDQKHAQSERE